MGILTALIGVAVVMLVLGTAVPVLWPLVADTSDNITAMTGTDVGTTTIQALWPIILLVIGLGIAVGLIIYALKRFNIIGGGIGAFFLLPVGSVIDWPYLLVMLTVAAITLCIALRFGKNRKFSVFKVE